MRLSGGAPETDNAIAVFVFKTLPNVAIAILFPFGIKAVDFFFGWLCHMWRVLILANQNGFPLAQGMTDGGVFALFLYEFISNLNERGEQLAGFGAVDVAERAILKNV